MRRSFGFAIVMLCWVGCGEDEGDEGDSDLQPCPQIPTTALDGMPVTLRASGLYREGSEALAEGVREFRPQFELWTDGATKRRFIALPAGTSIDTSDTDAWVFPPGTRVWKEFVRDGVRVETRLLRKVDAATWQPVTYVWREDQTDADPFLDGIVDARSTAHDVPAVADCAACHAGAEDFVLGFSAVQLAHPDAGLDLDTASALGWLSDPMMNDAVQVPGDADTRAALGVLHANCGHCHNAHKRAASSSACYTPNDEDFELALYVSDLGAVTSTAVYRTAVSGDEDDLIRPGNPGGSEIRQRLARRGGDEQMPPLGTEVVDDAAVATIDAWIRGL